MLDKRRRMCYNFILVCPVCGAESYVPRFKTKKREYHHKKDMWCWKCRADRQLTEYKDTELWIGACL